MNDMDKPLPDYANPPVVEVALSVQFEPLKALRAAQIGLLWAEFRERFPLLEEHPPIDPVIERFGGRPVSATRGIRFQLVEAPPTPRSWFLSESGNELIQVQQDRFVQNWRKATGEIKYPRYKHLRETFAGQLQIFRTFLQRERLGDLVPNQCEVTYVNHIVAGNGWQDFGDLDKVLTILNDTYSDGFLEEPEDVRLGLRYVIRNGRREPLGRLHIAVEPAFRKQDDCPMYVMNLTARGRPDGEGLEGVMRFLDIGREWVVRGFTSITTAQMHLLWGRTDAE